MATAPLRFVPLLLALLPSPAVFAQGKATDPVQLAERLSSSSKEARRQAAFELAQLGKKAEPALAALVKALGDRDQQVLFQVAQALAGIGPPAEAAVPGLIRNLRSGDRQVSYRSAYALGRIGPAAVPELIKMLGSDSSSARAVSARALSWVKPPPPAAVEPLIGALGDSEDSVRRNASEALGGYGEAAAAGLAKALGSAEALIRRGSARALSLMGSGAEPAVSALVKALEDGDAPVRGSAVSALSKLGLPAERLVPMLMARLEDPEASVRSSAVQALSRQRPGDVARELAALLDGGEEETIQAVALVAERLGSRARAVLPGLIAAAARIGELRPDSALARALGVFGDEAAALLLKKLSEEKLSSDQAERFILALGFTARAAVDRFRDTLGRGLPLARLGAAKALGQAGEAGKEALPELLGGLEDDEPRVRAACIGSLAALGFPAREYAAALLELIEDPDEQVRAAAVSAAGEMEADQQVKLLPILIRSLADSSAELRRAVSQRPDQDRQELHLLVGLHLSGG
ncbi:MAG: HEAT repeat domain-containing protein [Planctomycetota bacterium]